MSLQYALGLKREELEEQQRRLSFSDLQKRLADLPRPKGIPDRWKLPTPSQASSEHPAPSLIIPVANPFPVGEGSSLSLDALIAEELNAASRQKRLIPEALELIPELKRRELPSPHASLPTLPVPEIRHVFAPVLQLAPAIMVMWTDAAFYGGSPADLESLHMFVCQKYSAESRTMPTLIRADLFLTPYQLLHTLLLGAGAAIVVADPLSHTQLQDFWGWSREYNLDILLYISSEKDVQKVQRAGISSFVVGSGDLFDAQSRAKAGPGPLHDVLRRWTSASSFCWSWGGISTLENHDARARFGANGLIVGRGYVALRTALRDRTV